MNPRSVATGLGWAALRGPVALMLGLLSGCFDQTVSHIDNPRQGPAAAVGTGPVAQAAGARAMHHAIDEKDLGPFKLKPEWSGPCQRAEVVDVNLGHAPENFVRAAYCQITGKEPSAEIVRSWAEKLSTQARTRRIDVVRSICEEEKRICQLAYSDPWENHPELTGAPVKKVKRDVGAVFMYFFNCPNEVNCKMDWANTHAPGMAEEHPLLGFGEKKAGYYVPSNPGFWRRELVDAKYAGLDFLLLNTYGPDIEDKKLEPLARALTSLEDPIKIAFFDDTWTWGQPYFSEAWKQKPDLDDTEAAAKRIYEMKWKPFFSQVDKRHWYRFKGKPFVYFYNAGTLLPRTKSAALITRLKEMFAADFQEEPFVDADSAYFEDAAMERVADARYQWFTFNSPERRSRSTLKGHVIDHAMVKWDAVGRDHPGKLPRQTDLIIKDAVVFSRVLEETRDAELLVIATWNDLGEGTGIHRNYDYYFHGQWQRPDYFMQLLRKSQSGL
ncbi:DUF5010 domain-containing protein [Polyangium sp. 15x6]|uniref:DUF5010 domain-containing protein n=1 Tax=Polyangium sp. 15x6 TaxID=3042687 RepID=UPI00249A2722|nr:DUF5010 domain-containing protein [Polyangium sp. 15x6]MDI3289943.1 DUF5010 domain-containing protein [Polyangium sp. 15x6]